MSANFVMPRMSLRGVQERLRSFDFVDEGHMTRSSLAAIGTVILAVLISCSGTSAQGEGKQPDWINTAGLMPPRADQDRMSCEAALQAYDEQGCEKNCTDECKSIGSDLSECKNIGKRSAVACKQ